MDFNYGDIYDNQDDLTDDAPKLKRKKVSSGGERIWTIDDDALLLSCQNHWESVRDHFFPNKTIDWLKERHSSLLSSAKK